MINNDPFILVQLANCLVVLFLIVLPQNGHCQFAAPTFELKEGEINATMLGSINTTAELVVYYYQITDQMILGGHTNIRVELEVSQEFTNDCPLLISIRENRAAISWELPLVYTNNRNVTTNYYSAGRTLCLPTAGTSLAQTILIALSTCSDISKSYSLKLSIMNDLAIGLSEPKTSVISPTAPIFYRFVYPTDSVPDLFFVQVDSEDPTCAMISIQPPQCPVLDQENNIQFEGYWQSMTYKAGMTVRTSQYPDGFFIVLIVLKDNERCEEYSGLGNTDILTRQDQSPSPRIKTISFTIYESIGESGYVLPTLIPLAFIFGLILLVLIVLIVFQHLKYKLLIQRGEGGHEHVLNLDTPNNNDNSTTYRVKFQSPLYIADIKKIDSQKLLAQSRRYYISLLVVAVFYCVPVFQLIINYLKVVYRTGEEDICYYNFYCARPLGYVMDFNHIYSNTGYIILGIAFIGIVKLRQGSYCVVARNEDYLHIQKGTFRRLFPLLNSNLEYGVLQHFGLFYALGLALVLEGLLSGAYHICPNQSNFQFDTSFMYAIAFLGIVKIYQFRHPVYISADITFVSLAFVASSAVLGLLFNNLIFKISFSIVHLVAVGILLLYLYNFGYVLDESGNVVTSWIGIFKGTFIQNWRDIAVPHWSRLILPFLTIFFNVTIVVLIWTMMQDSNFATQILAIFVVNLFVYMSYYIIMKWIHNEYRMKLWIQPFIYLTLSGGLWVVSLYYFQNALSSWDKSPAESKSQNAECTVFDFYDNHDLWHFLSAGALFCSFMLLLTIDDDLVTRKHDRIFVF